MLNCHRDLDDVVGCVVSDGIRSQLKLEREGWSLSDAALASGTGEGRRGVIYCNFVQRLQNIMPRSRVEKHFVACNL